MVCVIKIMTHRAGPNQCKQEKQSFVFEGLSPVSSSLIASGKNCCPQLWTKRLSRLTIDEHLLISEMQTFTSS